MSFGSAKIIAVPSSKDAHSKQEMGVELTASAARTRANDYKYTYDFGYRHLGDSMIELRRDSKEWSAPQDVELVIDWRAKNGERLTYAEIKIDQSSTMREAHILEGGIGEDHIRLLIKSKNTYWFKYEYRMYARKLTTEVHLERV